MRLGAESWDFAECRPSGPLRGRRGLRSAAGVCVPVRQVCVCPVAGVCVRVGGCVCVPVWQVVCVCVHPGGARVWKSVCARMYMQGMWGGCTWGKCAWKDECAHGVDMCAWVCVHGAAVYGRCVCMDVHAGWT